MTTSSQQGSNLSTGTRAQKQDVVACLVLAPLQMTMKNWITGFPILFGESYPIQYRTQYWMIRSSYSPTLLGGTATSENIAVKVI